MIFRFVEHDFTDRHFGLSCLPTRARPDSVPYAQENNPGLAYIHGPFDNDDRNAWTPRDKMRDANAPRRLLELYSYSHEILDGIRDLPEKCLPNKL